LFLAMDALNQVLSFVIVLGVIIFVHEAGHSASASACSASAGARRTTGCR